ncbi:MULTISPECIES: hydrolase [unclassified Modicisalibacter]|uniref:hydrolase n=1 Tax=unclassified Modicisalibacter TaxID=2679913 RepID=UPI001CC94AE0|nr:MULTISPECIES: hydrolase [unclassified Modicisalibacter]MBZ9556637.1 hydrolase [Modicisalibacter sp. R2A 31.J]MBZ9574894.1 hydrolase [Modicisalibacter sp. MOD 31.J]
MSRTIVPADFVAAPGLGNRHVQTLLPLMRALRPLERDTEILNLPDGDFVELAWVRPAPLSDEAPIFLLFHGLEGSFDSPYARELLATASRLGWRAVLMHFRGCGQGPNRLARAYHSGDTADAYWLIGQLARRYPRALKVAAGVSLGGNMLVKLVAEQGGDGLDLAGAIAIGAPLDLAASADALNRGFARVYQRHLLKSLKRKIADKLESHRSLPIDLSAHQLAQLDTFWAYDNAVTAPLHGFSSASDYYRRASAGRLLRDIELPMLVLHAADDPFMPAELFERLPAPGDAVRLEIAPRGGHVGFVESRHGRLGSWLARRVARQLGDWMTVTRPLSATAQGD